MKLRQAKKIFNRVCDEESRRYDGREMEDSVHRDSLKACGYSTTQAEAACNRLYRHDMRRLNRECG